MSPPHELQASVILHAALLDFLAAPGRYHVGLRQPPVLFASVGEILRIAVRGASAELPLPRARAVRNAALFFLRSGLLHPDADHYQVLGLQRGSVSADMKERYRLLMRLTHPDFASAESASWPADAAARINRAYEVLSSPTLRGEYEERLAPRVPPAPARPLRGRPLERRVRPDRRKAFRALALLIPVLATALWLPSSEPDYLVQHPRQARPLAPSHPVAAAPELTAPGTSLPGEPGPAPVLSKALQARPRQPPRVESGQPARTIQSGSRVAVVAAHVAAVTAPATSSGRVPTLREVQPLLTRLLQKLESGKGEHLIGLVAGDGARSSTTQAFLRQYQRIAGVGRQVRLGQVRFASAPREDVLLVTSHARLYVDGVGARADGELLVLSAEFALRGGRILLTGLGTPED